MKRRLAAILAADVVGYGAMMQRDELGTIQTIKGHLGAFESHLGLHHGRIIKTLGDGFLAEFSSVVNAVSCAETLQRISAERNRALMDSDRAVFRMGVHAGDVIEDGNDLLGDGVNVAARLESIGKPGTVTISARVHEDVEGRLDLTFRDLGLKILKEGEKPVRVFELEHRAAPRPVAPALPDKPSIAVLPLVALSDDSGDGFLADGLSEDLTTALSGVPWLFVIARNSSFSYKGLAIDVRQIGKELGVRYIVEGSLRRSGSQVRISAQLVDASDGRHIWADRYDGTLENVFELQDRIVSEVVGTIAPQIQSAEIRRSVRRRPDDLTTYDMYLNAIYCLNSARLDDAQAHLRRALEVFPDYASAKAVLGWCATLAMAAWQTSVDNDALEREGLRLCHEALDSAQRDVETDAYAGYSLAFMGDNPAHGMDLLEGAVEHCPSFAWAWVSRAMLEAFYGDAERGRAFGENALRMNPRDPLIFRTYLALTNCDIALRDYERALARAEEGLRCNSGILGLQMYRAVSLVRLGRDVEAREEVVRVVARHPLARASGFDFIGARFHNLPPVKAELLAAGLPE